MVNAAEALERQLQAMRVLADILANKITPATWSFTPDRLNQIDLDRRILEVASPMFWTKETTAATMAMLPAFELGAVVCERELLYTDVAFCWFEQPTLSLVQGDGQAKPVHALTWCFAGGWEGKSARRLLVTGYTLEAGKLRPIGGGRVPEGKPLSLFADGEPPSDALIQSGMTLAFQFVACAGTFLRQKIAVVQEAKADRHSRKRIAAAGWLGDPIVAVIHLRERERAERRSDEDSTRHYQWRWMVRTHTRQQWYPSIDKHLPIIVGPYLKGPDDKPIKPRSTPIFLVNR